jgi:mono/diheme cytochrome c family protein
MNYPVWELYYTGGGFLIALIAVVHVYVAHFAVGGGLFLVLTEMKGLRENSSDVIEYTKKHTKFFLLVTMVFSSVTGVGIWFVISLVSPAATSVIVHTFVFAFATEWVFFTLEIVAIFIYFYTFNKIEDKAHLIVGWLYAIFALISLVLINGIISFMLTPGDFYETKNFWDGFFNPSFWSSMCFRITIALVLAGIFGFVTSVFIKDTKFREKMVQYCAKWLLFPFIFMVLFAWWYFSSLPDVPKAMILGRSPELITATKLFVFILPVLFITGLIMAIRMPQNVKKPMAFVILLIGLVYMGSFEWIREAGRRPYLIPGYMYSNSIIVENEAKINKQGLLKTAKWVKHKEINDDNILEAGKEIFKIQCSACHSVGGPLNDILPVTEKFNVFGMDSQLTGQGKINDYMPKFMGTKEERLAVSRYIVEKLHLKTETPTKQIALKEPPFNIPAFDEEKDEYVLLAWSNPGRKSMPDSGFIFSAPNNNISAQLIQRGETPEIVTDGVELVYETPDKALNGKMQFIEDNSMFAVDSILLSSSSSPLLIIKAIDKADNTVLAQTILAASASREMGCKNCHGGKAGRTKNSPKDVETDILLLHDKISKTELKKIAEQGKPVICQSCHSDAVPESKEEPVHLNLSAAIHGFHANYLSKRGADACSACHITSSPGHEQSFPGLHNEIGLDCTSCHGNMEDHALSLLKGKDKIGQKSAKQLMKHLIPTRVDSIKDIKPRSPWINQPDCLNCHVDFDEPETDETFNQWTQTADELFRSRMDDAGIMCQACHSTTHALYPTNRVSDNIQPRQYQSNPYPMGANKNCKVCHTIDMEDELHHPNTLTMFRNVQ